MVKSLVVTGVLCGACAVACAVIIGLVASVGGHRQGPMLVALALELASWVTGLVLVVRAARANVAKPAWAPAVLFVAVAGLAAVPLIITTALAFDH
jgi:hypothetical protein